MAGWRMRRGHIRNAVSTKSSARMAMAGLTAGTPDYLRAQDIAMVSKIELKKDKKGNRD